MTISYELFCEILDSIGKVTLKAFFSTMRENGIMMGTFPRARLEENTQEIGEELCHKMGIIVAEEDERK